MPLDRALALAAHRPGTGSLRFQSMNWFIVSRSNSTGSERSLTSAFELGGADARDEVVQLFAVLAGRLVVREPALDRLGHPLGRQARLQARAELDGAAFEVAADVRDVGGDRVLADLDRGAVEADSAEVVLAAAVRAAATS